MNIYIYDDDMMMRKSDGSVIVQGKEMLQKLPIKIIDSVVVLGNTTLTCPLIKSFSECGIQVVYCTKSGRPLSILSTFNSKNVVLKIKQISAYMDQSKRLKLAKYICAKKLETQRYYLEKRRGISRSVIKDFQEIEKKIDSCNSLDSLRGIEGCCANIYFNAISMISPFEKRSRRPAEDYFNALLNLTYAMIQSKILCTLTAVGLNASIGFLHEIKSGRASLALDLMEFFRSDADRFVINAVNRREFTENDFQIENAGYYLTNRSFKKFIEKYSKEIQVEDRIYLSCMELAKMIGENCEDEILSDCI